MELKLIRDVTGEFGTFGQMLAPTQGGLYSALHTAEDDWKDNRRGESCIPDGDYQLVRTVYHKHNYETFEVVGVQGRSRILIHPGNTEEDTDGCILVGMRRGKLWVPDEDSDLHTLMHKDAVVESQEAFRVFMGWMKNVDRAAFQVLWAPGVKPY